MRAHFVQRWFVRAFDLLAERAGFGARVNIRRAGSEILPLSPR
jgi:hypothetical protein